MDHTTSLFFNFFINIVYAKNKIDSLIPKIDILPGFIPIDLTQRLQFTTEVSVWPNTFPYVGCCIQDGVDTGIECGELFGSRTITFEISSSSSRTCSFII